MRRVKPARPPSQRWACPLSRSARTLTITAAPCTHRACLDKSSSGLEILMEVAIFIEQRGVIQRLSDGVGRGAEWRAPWLGSRIRLGSVCVARPLPQSFPFSTYKEGSVAYMCQLAVKANNITHLTQEWLSLSFWDFSSRKKKKHCLTWNQIQSKNKTWNLCRKAPYWIRRQTAYEIN